MSDNKSSVLPDDSKAGSIDAESIKAMLGEAVKPLQERLDSQSKYIAGLEKQIKDAKPAAPEKPTDKETELVSRVKELEEKTKKQDDRTDRLRRKATVDVVRDAFVEKGMKPETAAWAAKAFVSDNQTKIVTEENDDMDFTFRVVEGEGKSALKDYATAWVTVGAGSDLIPSKKNPQTPESGNKGAAPIKYTQADLNNGNYDINLLNSGKAIVEG